MIFKKVKKQQANLRHLKASSEVLGVHFFQCNMQASTSVCLVRCLLDTFLWLFLCLAALAFGQHLLASFLLAFFVVGCRFLCIPLTVTMTSPGLA